MEHVNAKYLKAILDGKTVEYAYTAHLNECSDEFAWSDVMANMAPKDDPDLIINTSASQFFLTGIQSSEYHITLRIKDDE